MKLLIIIDMQNDFVNPETGTIVVSKADTLIDGINAKIDYYKNTGNKVIATKDWHPKGHISFASTHEGKEVYDEIDTPYGKQVLWPDHCVQNESGSAFAKGLETSFIEKTFYKGEDKDKEAYSALHAVDGSPYIDIINYIETYDFESIEVVGISLEYCVYETIKDLVKLHEKVILNKGLTLSIDKSNRAEYLKKIKNLGVSLKR